MRTPGFIIKNDTIWPLQISLNQVGPLYFDVIQPGESFIRETGSVFFTIKASIFLDEKERITDWDAIMPVAVLAGTVILAAVTAGATAYATGPAIALSGMAGISGVSGLSSAGALATATAASALTGAGFSSSAALVIGGAVVGGTGAALSATAEEALRAVFTKENISVSEAGCYAGEASPFNTDVTPWRVTGGPSFRQVEGENQVKAVGGPLKLEQASLISITSDNTLLEEMGANSYKEKTKKTLIENIRGSDNRLKLAKESYGDGVSVKGIITNVSAFHFLKMIDLKQETGKNWSDPKCIPPTNSVDPLRTSVFFHAKPDSEASGCRAGVTYRVLDKDSVIQGVISIAWENPYQGDFVYCIKVSKSHDLLESCLDYCNNSSESKIEVDETIKVSAQEIKKFIITKVFNAHTAYLFLCIKTDDLVKEILSV